VPAKDRLKCDGTERAGANPIDRCYPHITGGAIEGAWELIEFAGLAIFGTAAAVSSVVRGTSVKSSSANKVDTSTLSARTTAARAGVSTQAMPTSKDIVITDDPSPYARVAAADQGELAKLKERVLNKWLGGLLGEVATATEMEVWGFMCMNPDAQDAYACRFVGQALGASKFAKFLKIKSAPSRAKLRKEIAALLKKSRLKLVPAAGTSKLSK
jgi:hypothetical protein